MPGLDSVVVVVPARDEENSIGYCLRSLRVSAALCPVPVEVVVVADRCRDRTAEVASSHGVRVIRSEAGCVGTARRLGAVAGLSGRTPGATWLVSTDADSTVPDLWLRHHHDQAAAGVDLLLGTVRLAGGDAGLDDGELHVPWQRRYAAKVRLDGHDHVHGANLGVRGSTYVAAGGFPDLPAHEDRFLVGRVRALPGARVRSSVQFPVRTSDRLTGRAPAGVAHDLRDLQVRPRRAPSDDAA